MPLILNEDDVHALQAVESPFSGWVRDSTNSPPWARCEAPGRARRPPRPPSASSRGRDLGDPQKQPPLSFQGEPPPLHPTRRFKRRDRQGWREVGVEGSVPTHFPGETSQTGHFHDLPRGRLFRLPLEPRVSFPTGTRDLRSPFPMPMRGGGGGGGQPPRVSAGRRSGTPSSSAAAGRSASPRPLPRGLRGARSGAAARGGAGSGRGNRNVTSLQTN